MPELVRVIPGIPRMMARHRWWLGAVVVLLSGPVHAGDDPLLACRFAEPPVVPGGATADAATMEAAAAQVRQFVTDMQGPLDCLNGLDADSDTAAAQLRLLHDNGVDQMHAIAKAFNRELAIFRSREDETVHPDQVRDLQNLTHH